MADPFLAEIVMFGGNFAPRGWAFCNGQLLPIAQNTAVFSLLGTTYGGDGRTTFALPDLRGRIAMNPRRGPGLSTYRLGERSGVENVTLTQLQMPSHTHVVTPRGSDEDPTTAEPGGQVHATLGANAYNAQPDVDMATATASITGGSQPHTNLGPFLCVNFIIALQGTFPSRS